MDMIHTRAEKVEHKQFKNTIIRIQLKTGRDTLQF